MGGIIIRPRGSNRNRSSLGRVNERDLQEYYTDQTEPNRKLKYDRALVVDDSRFNRKMLGKTIDDFFEEVTYAEDGLEAIKHVEESIKNKKPFDIIFMDSIMPNMGGIEATAKIRGLGYLSLIIGVTGDITEEDAEKFVQCGVNDVMLKPLLLPHVESILIGIVTQQQDIKPFLLLLFIDLSLCFFLCFDRFKSIKIWSCTKTKITTAN